MIDRQLINQSKGNMFRPSILPHLTRTLHRSRLQTIQLQRNSLVDSVRSFHPPCQPFFQSHPCPFHSCHRLLSSTARTSPPSTDTANQPNAGRMEDATAASLHLTSVPSSITGTDAESTSDNTLSLSSSVAPVSDTSSATTPPLVSGSDVNMHGWRWYWMHGMFGMILFAQFATFLIFIRHNVIDIVECRGPSMLPTMSAEGDILLIARSNFASAIIDWYQNVFRSSPAANSSSLNDALLHPHHPTSRAPSARRGLLARLSYLFKPSELDYTRGDVVIALAPYDPNSKICKRVIGLSGDMVCTPSMNSWFPDDSCVTVPPGSVWLQGDNLSNSNDSRMYGTVPCGLVKGKVIYRLYPFESLGPILRTLKHYTSGEVITNDQYLNAPHSYSTTAMLKDIHSHDPSLAALFQQLQMANQPVQHPTEQRSS